MMNTTMKLVRFGHRTPNRGVITIASQLFDNKLFYGVTFCNPKDGYNKQFGQTLAIHDLTMKIAKNQFTFFDQEVKHCNIIYEIVWDIIDAERYPKWAETLLIENAYYPKGLKRYGNKGVDLDDYDIINITVASYEAKEQLLKALKYIHNLRDLDTQFIMVNELVHTSDLQIQVINR